MNEKLKKLLDSINARKQKVKEGPDGKGAEGVRPAV